MGFETDVMCGAFSVQGSCIRQLLHQEGGSLEPWDDRFPWAGSIGFGAFVAPFVVIADVGERVFQFPR